MLFLVEHAALLALLLAAAAAAGTAVMGARAPLALRSVIGLAVAGQLFVILGTFGALGPASLWVFAAIVIVAALTASWNSVFDGLALKAGRSHAESRSRGEKSASVPPSASPRLGVRTVHFLQGAATASLLTFPLFLLALYPPIAFDETLYHLPFVQAIARSGAIRFLPGLRFPAFPQLHELLCVPAFLIAGDTATHLVALAEVVMLAGILIEWPEQRLAGLLAAALVLGNPIVIQMATVTYVESALMLFVAAGFYCLDRRRLAAAGFLLGTACSVKYLGWYFAAAAFICVLMFVTNRRRNVPLFLGAFALAVLPMYARIVALTGNPLFPFLPKVFGANAWTLTMQEWPPPTQRIVNGLRLFWDITFARARLNWQPPYSPLFAVAMGITLMAAARDRRAAFLAALCAGFIAVFSFLPQDSRYLLPLLPLVTVAAVITTAPLLRRDYAIALIVLSIAPGMAYAGYRLARQWPLPVSSLQRRLYLEAHIPEYRAFERRGPGRIYVSGAEQLKYYGGDDLLGDVEGPYGYQAIFGTCRDGNELAARLARFQVRYLLMSQAHSPLRWRQLPTQPRFELVYADGGAELWRTMPP